MEDIMSFNPLSEKGIPIEKQIRNWSELNVKPFDKRNVHPYTRTRVIFMNGIEVEAALFGHQFARNTNDMELKRNIAMSRRVEQQQQKTINWLIPGNETVLETTIGYEQVAVDLTSNLAKNEKNKYIKQALDFALLEDFDHLYRYANLMEMTTGEKADQITGQYTEITVGRPTVLEHRHPFDDVRKHYGPNDSIKTKLNVMTITAAEQQTMNYYMNVGPINDNMTARGLYLEIAQIEEQHVTHYESLMDPSASWFEKLLLHEYNECYLYYSLMQQEVDNNIKAIWELHLNQEIAHLQKAVDLMKRYEKRNAADLLPKQIPEPVVFESNVDYVRDILATQVDYNAYETDFLPPNKFEDDRRYKEYQGMVNKGDVPSVKVIEENKQRNGREYRQELAGPHPMERYRI
jgi:hypothetical protein